MAPPARIGAHAFVRTCASSVYGQLDRRTVQSDSVRVGPLHLIALTGYANARPSTFVRPNGRLNGLKVLAVTRRDTTISIAQTDRRHASLIYDPERFSAGRVDRGDYEVILQVCHPAPDRFGTQFNGGFLVDGPRCVSLDVAWNDGARNQRIVVPFGTGDCAG